MISRLISIFALFLCLADIGSAAIVQVGGGSQANGVVGDLVDSQDNTFPGSVTSGNFLIAVGSAFAASAAPATISVTSTCSAALTVVSSNPAGTHRQFIAYGVATSSGTCTVTVNPAGSSSYLSYSIDEFSGVLGGLDVNAGGATGTGTGPAQSITTAAADALIIGVMSFSDLIIVTQGVVDPVIEIGEESNGFEHQAYSAGFLIATTAGTYGLAWIIDTTITWSTHLVSFSPTGAAITKIRHSVSMSD